MEIALDIDINASAACMYDAITTQQGLAGWWTPNVAARPEVGFLNEFRFTKTRLGFCIVQLDPDRRVVWSGEHVPEE